MSKDHQHIQCHECLCEFCVVCVDLHSVADDEAMLEGADKAHLN